MSIDSPIWGSRTRVMGIINVTPDSFSGDGLLSQADVDEKSHILEQAQSFLDAGADILDVGGESTRPGAQPVSAEDEIARVIPAIKVILEEFPQTTISIDTYKAPVAEAALQAGACLVNDVWGLKADPDMASVIAQHGVPAVLMHNRSSWAHAEIKEHLGGRYIGMPYENLLEDIKRELLESITLAHQAGIHDEQIILDPGVGFGKTVEQNLELINRLAEIKALGYPLLLGVSRKSFIGYTLDLPTDQRLEGSAAAVAIGIAHGADIVRVHDVAFMVNLVRMADAIVRR